MLLRLNRFAAANQCRLVPDVRTTRKAADAARDRAGKFEIGRLVETANWLLAQQSIQNEWFVRFGCCAGGFALPGFSLCRLGLLGLGFRGQFQRTTHAAAGEANRQKRATYYYSSSVLHEIRPETSTCAALSRDRDIGLLPR